MKDITSHIFNQICENSVLQIIGPLISKNTEISMELPTIFIDGAAKLNQKPNRHWVIGDADGHLIKDDFDILLPTEKDQSDLCFCLDQLQKHSNKSHLLIFHGFSGGRYDHDLFVLGDALNFLENSASMILMTERQFILSHQSLAFEYQGLFSVGSLNKNKVSISGKCQYPLQDSEIKPFSSHGLSNQSHGNVEIQAQSPFWIYFDKMDNITKIQNENFNLQEYI